jgi:hypothetical protein
MPTDADISPFRTVIPVNTFENICLYHIFKGRSIEQAVRPGLLIRRFRNDDSWSFQSRYIFDEIEGTSALVISAIVVL